MREMSSLFISQKNDNSNRRNIQFEDFSIKYYRSTCKKEEEKKVQKYTWKRRQTNKRHDINKREKGVDRGPIIGLDWRERDAITFLWGNYTSSQLFDFMMMEQRK